MPLLRFQRRVPCPPALRGQARFERLDGVHSRHADHWATTHKTTMLASPSSGLFPRNVPSAQFLACCEHAWPILGSAKIVAFSLLAFNVLYGASALKVKDRAERQTKKGFRTMKRTVVDSLHPSEHVHSINSECQRIRAGWSHEERQRRAGLAAVRQFALWESITHSPFVVTVDRRSVVTCR
jgi:hypothetical protein